MAPYLVLLMVSLSDGKIDPKQLGAMSEIMTKPLNPLLAELTRDCGSTPVEIINRIMQMDENMVFVLQEISSLKFMVFPLKPNCT